MKRKSLWDTLIVAFSHSQKNRQIKSKRKNFWRNDSLKKSSSLLLRLENLEDRQLLSVNFGEVTPDIFSSSISPTITAQNLDFDSENIQATQNSLSKAINPDGATTWVVTSAADDNTNGTLRKILANNSVQPGDTITFHSSLKNQKITFASELAIFKGVTIDASSLYDMETNTPGITFSGEQKHRVATIANGTAENPVTLIGINITEGNVYVGLGGAIFNTGVTNFIDCVISGNDGVANQSKGGAIRTRNDSVLTLTNCTVSGNSAAEGGGAISCEKNATLIMTNCIVSNNTTTIGSGGAIQSENGGTVTLTNCAFYGNYATSHGGALDLTNTNLTLTNCTIAGNTALQSGAGIRSIGLNAQISLTNSIVSKNDGENIFGSITSSNCSILGIDPWFVSSPVFDCEGHLTNSETIDLRLVANSWGINTGDNSVTLPAGDLNGNMRRFGSAVDIGAYEYQNTTAPLESISLVVNTEFDSFDPNDNKTSLREALFYVKDYQTISFDESLNGKTIYLDGAELIVTKAITIDASSLSNGITIDGDQKSGVFAMSGGTEMNPVKLYGLTISGGDASYGGGGINNNCNLYLERCNITDNHLTGVTQSGGAILNFSLQTLTMLNCSITNNSAKTGAGLVNGQNSTLILTNCLIANNTSPSSGGGIYNYSGTNSIFMTNCTITENSAKTGGGIYNGYSETATVTSYNCIIAENKATEDGNDFYQYVANGTNGFIYAYNTLSGYTNWTESANTILYDATKPLFTDATNNDYTLAENSQAIDQGNNSYAVDVQGNPLLYDLAGNTRISNDIVDLGAHEYQQQQSDPLVVDSLEDTIDANDGMNTLREAIAYANSGDTITFDASLSGGTITLAGSQLTIKKSIAIDASSLIGGVTIDANKLSRVFTVEGGTANAPVILNGLTIQNGKADNGGGIYNYYGTLTLINCTISGNSASKSGGGIDNNNGKLTMTNCIVSGNSASSNTGGGINNNSTLTLTNCTVTGNSADCGGGIYNSSTLTLTNCTVSRNSASWRGGGIYINGYTAIATLKNTIVALNTSSSSGHDIYKPNGKINAYNSLSSFSAWDNATEDDVENYIYDSTKPLFTDATNNDYTLAANSQAIDKGNNDYAVDSEGNPLLYDLAGNTRIINNIVDLGAYEYHEPISLVVDFNEDIINPTDNKITLREAIAYAQAGETITFASSLNGETIILAGTELTINKSIIIDASDLTGGVTIDANKLSRVFNIQGGTANAPVILNGLKIQNGKAKKGAGIYNYYGTLTLINCNVSGNSASNNGGGIELEKGFIKLTNCTISGNTADYGAGINSDGTVTLTNCSLSENVAVYSGGGAYNEGLLTITNSVVLRNNAKWGAGISNWGTSTLTNCTMSGNIANETDTSGGIENVGTLTLYNSIVVQNMAGGSINDIAPWHVEGYVSVSNAWNTLSSYTDWDTGSDNLGYDATLPLFNDAANNVYILAANSQAIDKGNNAYAVDAEGNPILVDLLNMSRIYYESVDLGAYEYQLPKAPTNVRFGTYDPDTHSVDMFWTDTATNEDGFRIEYSTNDTTWILSQFMPENTEYRLCSNMQSDKNYQYRIRTYNVYGSSDWAYGSVSTHTLLNAPSNVRFEDYDPTAKTVEMLWDDNSSNEKGFRIEYSTDNGTTWRFSQNKMPNVTSRTCTGLMVNRDYMFRVRAYNHTGSSDWAVGSFSTKFIPVAPSNVRFDNYNPTAKTVEMLWNDNSNNEKGFRIEYSTDNGATWRFSQNKTANETTRTCTGLTPNKDYMFRVRAYNDSGSSEWAVGSFSTKIIPAAPSDVTFEAYNMTGKTVTMSWVDNSDNEKGFRIEYSTDNGTTWRFSQNKTANETSRTYTGLMANKDYMFRVRAYNDSGFSDWAVGSFTTKVAPVAPSDITFGSYNVIDKTVQMSWTDNSNNEKGFRVEYSTDNGANWRLSQLMNANSTTRTCSGIKANTTYMFRVRAYNDHGSSDWAVATFVPETTSALQSMRLFDSIFEDEEDWI